MTDILAPYPGSLYIPPDAFRIYLRAVLVGLVNNGFRNIIILNGHGPQVGVLQELATEISLQHHVNTLLVNWWILANPLTHEFFGEDGGHATNDETAMVQAADPKLVHWELFTGKDMASALPSPADGWSATPFPSTILMYTDGQGLPKDKSQAKADEYSKKVIAKVKATGGRHPAEVGRRRVQIVLPRARIAWDGRAEANRKAILSSGILAARNVGTPERDDDHEPAHTRTTP